MFLGLTAFGLAGDERTHNGAYIYRKLCVECHGHKGEGVTGNSRRRIAMGTEMYGHPWGNKPKKFISVLSIVSVRSKEYDKPRFHDMPF